MATLAVIPSLPVHFTAPDQVLLTQKFVDGMSQYAKLWDGPVVAVMHPHSDMSTGNLDDAVFSLDELPFQVRSADFSGSALLAALADADVVMLGGDQQLTNLTKWFREQNIKAVFLTEYSLKTRLQIINAETRNPLIKWRKYLWEWGQERRNRKSVAAADAVQCNGTPTYEAYRQLNSNTLLFLDSRVTADLLAEPEIVASRQAAMLSSTQIRLAYSGRLNAMKGADDLIEVARHLAHQGVDFNLEIYGEGELRPLMERRIREYGLEEQVHLHGVVDYATELLPAIRNNADLFVCCHRQGDPSCTYLETFACGVPIAGYANEALCGLTSKRPVGWTTPLNQPEKLALQIANLSGNREQLRDAGSAALGFAGEHIFEKEFGARIAQIESLIRPAKAPVPASNQPIKLPLKELAVERLQSLLRRRRAETLRSQAMTKRFPETTHERLLLVGQSERIPQSQIFPFHFYAAGMASAYDVATREMSLDHALDGAKNEFGEATIVAFQTPYDIADADLERLLDNLRQQNPEARLVYLDWSAPTDLRNAARLDPHIDVYIKKHALRERSQYGEPTLGDTNLSDHYARRLNVTEQEYCFPIPPGFMKKLMVGPSFATAPMLLPALMKPFSPGPERSIDLHARFAVNGTPWYQAMRSEAEVALQQFDDLTLAVGNTLPLYRFITELRRAKVCFSPFGYGEVCWRDYESIMAGTVLLKPDMSHIETNPDIFRPWETYVPLRWDLADFNATLRRLLDDADLRTSIAENAHAVLHDYLHSDGFVAQMQPMFAENTQ